jgi:hypothetical protein
VRVSFSCVAQAGEFLTTTCFLTLTSITQIPRMLSTYAEEPEIRIRRSHPCSSTTSGAAQEEQERLRVMLRLPTRPIAYRISLAIFHSRRHTYFLFVASVLGRSRFCAPFLGSRIQACMLRTIHEAVVCKPCLHGTFPSSLACTLSQSFAIARLASASGSFALVML